MKDRDNKSVCSSASYTKLNKFKLKYLLKFHHFISQIISFTLQVKLSTTILFHTLPPLSSLFRSLYSLLAVLYITSSNNHNNTVTEIIIFSNKAIFADWSSHSTVSIDSATRCEQVEKYGKANFV
jgi:uncharacterized Rmd1/YagE family protein